LGAGPGLYGYLEPVLYCFELAGGEPTYVRLAAGTEATAGSGGVAASQNDGSQPAPLQVSRVEIAYGRAD
jgi:hypothetical protein